MENVPFNVHEFIQQRRYSARYTVQYEVLSIGTIEIKLREIDYENKNWFELLIIKGFIIRSTVLKC